MKKAELAKKLRDEVGLGVHQVLRALRESDWNYEKALQFCWDQYKARSKNFQDRTCREGRIVTYSHHGNQLAVLVEIACETDFAAKTQEFLDFGQQVAMQIVAMNPTYLTQEKIPEEEAKAHLEHIRSYIPDRYKGMEFEKMLNERMAQWHRQVCLLEQGSIFNHQETVDDIRSRVSAKLCEKVEIRRWCRWELGVAG